MLKYGQGIYSSFLFVLFNFLFFFNTNLIFTAWLQWTGKADTTVQPVRLLLQKEDEEGGALLFFLSFRFVACLPR